MNWIFAAFLLDAQTQTAHLTLPPPDDAPATGEIKQFAAPIEGSGGLACCNDLRCITDATDSAQIAGLGEGSHGTRKFTAIRRRLLADLARRSGAPVLALEPGWAETLPLNRCVRTDVPVPPPSPLALRLNRPETVRVPGGGSSGDDANSFEEQKRLSDAYDALVYIQTSHAATPLPPIFAGGGSVAVK